MAIDRRSFLKGSLASAVVLGLPALAHAQDAPGTKPANPPEAKPAGATVGLEAPFSFAVVTDPHCAEEPGRGYPAEKYGTHVERFLRCVQKMQEQETKPDFLLITGDVHLWELRKHLDQVPIPMHVIAGNHESGAKKKEMRELFPEDFQVGGKPSDYYSFVHKGVRFVGVCDAGTGGEHVGQLASEDFGPRGQCEWLEGELGKPESHKVVFAHIPPHPRNADENMYMSRNDSVYFTELIRKTQPQIAFFGHLHRPTSEFSVGRTRLVTLRSCAWNSGADPEPLGFLMAEVTAAGIATREIATT